MLSVRWKYDIETDNKKSRMKERGLDETGLGLKQVAKSCEHNNKHSGSVIIGIFFFKCPTQS